MIKGLLVFIGHVLGTITSLLLYIYIVLGFFFHARKDKFSPQKAQIRSDSMPVLRPLPIPTKQFEGFDQLLAFVFVIRRWRVEEDYHFEYKGRIYVIPKGFEFDGASIPRPLWALLSPIGLLLIPGLIHDYGYRYDAIYTKDSDGKLVVTHAGEGKIFWDELFCDMGNEINGIQFLNALAKFGLQLGGRKAWDDWRVKNESIPGQTGDTSFHQDKATNDDTSADAETIDTVTESAENDSTELEDEFESGKTKTTVIGYINRNNQEVHGTRGVDGSEKNQKAYKMRCLNCEALYGSNGSEIFHRKCPDCQDGKPSINF